MSGLPNQIPLQSVPIANTDAAGNSYAEFNWYLFLYNLAKEVFGNQNSGGSTPISDFDLIDIVALNSSTTDIPQAFRKIANAQLMGALGVIPDGADIADLRKRIANLQVLVASLLIPADPPPKAGAVITVTPGSSPFTYTAIHNGTMFISGTVAPTLSFSRYGVNVPLGMSDGTIPMRESDQITLTWSGGTPPTLTFLPNQ